MSAISWANHESFTAPPASTSTASSGDDFIRSLQTSIALGLGTSFYWAGSAASQGASTASSGELQLGTMRFSRMTYTGGGFPNGFLLLEPTRVSLWHHGSAWTGLLAHSGMLDRNGGIGTAPFTSHWVVQEGIASSATTVHVIFPSAYSGTPFVALSYLTGATDADLFGVNLVSVDASGFTSCQSGFALNGTLLWRSEGTRAL